MRWVLADSAFNLQEKSIIKMDDFGLVEILQEIESIKKISSLIIFAEGRFKNSNHQRLDGITLLKHLLLNAELRFYQIPIVLIHVTPYDYILNKEVDNLIILAPNISRHYWMSEWQKKIPDFKSPETNNIRIEEFKKYIIYGAKDNQLSNHDARNEAGAIKLNAEWNKKFKIETASLHLKKQIFLEDIKIHLFSDDDKRQYLNHIKDFNKALVLEDEINKWNPLFNKIFPDSKYKSYSDFNDAKTYLKLTKEKVTRLFDKFSKDFYNSSCDSSNSKDFLNEISSFWKYDIIICDIGFKMTNQKENGIELIKLIREFDPYIPIIVFTASKKSRTIRNLKEINANVSSVFVKSYDPLKKLTDVIVKQKQNRLLFELQWLVELNKYRFSSSVNFYQYNYNDSKVVRLSNSHLPSIKTVLEILERLLQQQNLNVDVFKMFLTSKKIDYNVDGVFHKKLDLLRDIFGLFFISEIKYFLSKGAVIPKALYQLDKDNNGFISNESKYRRQRNFLYHSNIDKLEVDIEFKDFFVEYIFEFMDWLINPHQVEKLKITQGIIDARST